MIVIRTLLSIAAAFIAVGMAGIVRSRIKSHGVFMLAWRWMSGQPWHGRAHTNATWSRPGDRALTEGGYARRFWYRPRRRRAAWRSGGTLAVILGGWGLLAARWPTVGVLGALALLGAAMGIRSIIERWRRRAHWKQWVMPAHLAAAGFLSLPTGADPGSYLHVTRDRSSVTLQLPRDWSSSDGNGPQLVKAITSRLAIEQPEVRWMLAGPKPRLEITQSAPCPSRVSLADIMPAIDAASDDEVVFGLGKKRAVVKVSLADDSPHLGFSMGSGAGKSVTARTVLAQLLYKGSIALILDFKMISHHWAEGLPNVHIARRPDEIHDALVWVGAETSRRNEVAFAGANIDGTVTADVGPRIIIIAEELNATMSQLRNYWKKLGEKGRPPSIEGLDQVSFCGRQVRENIVYIGQRLSDKATGGGGDARENIGVIVFGRWKPATWKMLASDFAMPAKNLTPGRVQVVGNDVRECQTAYLTEQEARALAVAGRVSLLPAGMTGATGATGATDAPIEQSTAPDLCTATGDLVLEGAPVATVTLREAVLGGLLGETSVAAARSLRARDPLFPGPVGNNSKDHRYAIDDLVTYTNRRDAA